MNNPSASPAPQDAVKNRRFHHTVLFSLLGFVIFSAYTANVDEPLHLYEGLLIILLAALPVVLWTRHPTEQLPILEAFMLTFINAYAMPLLNDHGPLQAYPIDTITESGMLVLLFQTAVLSSFYLIRIPPKETPFWTQEIIPDEIGRYLGYGQVLNTIYTFINTFYAFIPGDLNSILRAVFFGVGVICTFIQGYRWGKESLKYGEKTYFIVNLTLQSVLLASTLYLTYTISLLILAFLGYVAGGRRIPLFTMITMLSLVAILHNGKAAMRAKYWDAEGAQVLQLSPTNLPDLFIEWFKVGLVTNPREDQTIAGKLVDRTSLIHMLCLVVDHTPRTQPYLNGLTYGYIPGQFIPRFFWPEKPLGTIATSTLAIHYGLQDEHATQTTTIAFGVIVEAYANFGIFGVFVVGLIIGTSLKTVYCWTSHSPIFSYAGIFTIILLAWSFQIEEVMSVWLSSLFQATVTALGVPLILRSILI